MTTLPAQGPATPAPSENRIHPIVAEASLLISEVNGALMFSEGALAQIRRAVSQVAPDEKLRMLGGLVDLAAHLERDRKAPQAANALLLAIASSVSIAQPQP